METGYQEISKNLPTDKNSIKEDRAKRMFESIAQREPDLLHLVPEGIMETDELFLFTLIAKAKDKGLKSDLLRDYVQNELDEKDYFGAVFGLAVANASKLGISDFDENFVHTQYQQALKSGENRQAWGISLLMKSDDINGMIVPMIRKNWNARENKAFEKIQDGTTLSELLDHIANNLKGFGKTFVAAMVEARAMSRPWIYETGETGDKLIAGVLEKLGYNFERSRDHIKVLRKIESSARK